MTMEDFLNVDGSGALQLVFLDKKCPTPAKQFYEWLKEGDGHLQAYNSTMKKLHDILSEKLKKEGVTEEQKKEFKKVYFSVREEILRTRLKFNAEAPKWDYEYISQLEGINVTQIEFLKTAELLTGYPEVDVAAKQNTEKAFDQIIDSYIKE